MPLVIHGLGGGHTHTHTYICTEVILRNQVRVSLWPARAWFKNLLMTGRTLYGYIRSSTLPNFRSAILRYYLSSKWMNGCQSDGFSSMGTLTEAMKLVMAGT